MKTDFPYCHVFSMESADEAYRQMDTALVERYDDQALHQWDDGGRYLHRCKKCGKLILAQVSEFHGFDDDDIYRDYVPVEDAHMAHQINSEYGPAAFENDLPLPHLRKDSRRAAYWIRKKGDEPVETYYTRNDETQLAKANQNGFYTYDPAKNEWIEAAQSEDWQPVGEIDIDFLMYKLQVAECLTHMYGKSYLNGWNFEWVKLCERNLYEDNYKSGEDPHGAAIDIGYVCG